MDLILRQGVDRALIFDRAIAAPLCNDILVDFLAARGFVHDERLIRAMRSHRRDAFLPEADLRAVYTDRAVNLLDDDDGWMQTSGSAPSIVISMIEALELPHEPGARVLEIGTGSGYSTAMMAAAMPEGRVITVELLDDVRELARGRLAAMGLDNVTVLAHGDDPFADGPVDRIVATCSFDELPPGWCRNLVDGGLLVVPVGAYVYKLQRCGDRLVGLPFMTAAFVPRREEAAVRLDSDPSVDAGVAGHFVWWGAEDFAEAVRSGGEPVAKRRAVVPPALMTPARVRLDLAELGHRFEFSGPHDWGFGLVTPERNAACVCRVAGQLGFRHYDDSPDEVLFELHGEPGAAERLADEIESRLVPTGEADVLLVEVAPVESAMEDGLGSVVRGAHRWTGRCVSPASC